MFGWLLGVLRTIVLLLLAAALMLALFVSRNWNRLWDEVPLPNLHASRDAKVIAHGKYLVMGPAHCAECHTGNVKEYERSFSPKDLPVLAGGFRVSAGTAGQWPPLFEEPDARSANGPRPLFGPADCPHAAPRRAPNGLASIPPLMPYGNMSDDDIVAIISYLRTLPAVRRDVRGNEWTLLGKVMKSIVPAAKPRMDVHPPRISPPQQMTAARGEYLASSVADCVGCHTPYNEMTGGHHRALLTPVGNPLDPGRFRGRGRRRSSSGRRTSRRWPAARS